MKTSRVINKDFAFEHTNMYVSADGPTNRLSGHVLMKLNERSLQNRREMEIQTDTNFNTKAN